MFMVVHVQIVFTESFALTPFRLKDATTVVRNDYLQHHVDTAQRPQNYIREASFENRYAEHPKLAELARLKHEVVQAHAIPPMYKSVDLRTSTLGEILGGIRFDVILIDPPLEEYGDWSSPDVTGLPPSTMKLPYWTWEEIGALAIEDVSANPSFVFIWVGNREGLDRGRELLYKWGYRRCEDISWIKTNKTWECNVDTDVIIAEEPPDRSTRKPDELYHLIERFCMGRRRLELFGNDHNIRPGWVTIGLGVSTSNWDKTRYASWFKNTSPPAGTASGASPLGIDRSTGGVIRNAASLVPTTAGGFSR
ncbi:hypothetical protein HKX48_005086 [Thoreauomyces humboldtii]|nr:hypothetical protein HKX48_005086 [Thoreauomyces humboldtii]